MGVRSSILFVVGVWVGALSSSASAEVDHEVAAEAGIGVEVDSNLERVRNGPGPWAGPSHFGRLHLATSTPLLLAEGRWGLRASLFAPGRTEPQMLADLHGAARIEVGPRGRFSFVTHLVGGGRALPWLVFEEPEGDPVDLVAMPSVAVALPRTSRSLAWRDWEEGGVQLRSRISMEMRGRPTEGLVVRGFGGVWARSNHWNIGEPGLARHGGGVGFEVAGTPPGSPLTVVGRMIATEHQRGPAGYRGPSGSEGGRLGGLGGVHLQIDSVARVEVEAGWLALSVLPTLEYDDRLDRWVGVGPAQLLNQGWILGPEGIVGRVEATLRPRDVLSLRVGAGREVSTAEAWADHPPVSRTAVWLNLDLFGVDRLHVTARLGAALLESRPQGRLTRAGNCSGGIDVRLVSALHVRVRGGVETYVSDAFSGDEAVAVKLWAGIVFRRPGQGPLDGAW